MFKKTALLFFCIACIGLTMMAQRKSVAILETYCADNSLNSSYLMMIGSSIETGIIKNPNYTAYNRAQLKSLMTEHEFQRSGIVPDEQIKRLGQMAGVDYVLASEAALLGQQVFVTAKVLNVETGQYEMSDNELMDYTPSAIQRGCQNLAAKLLNGGSTPQEVRAQGTNPVSNSEYQATNISGLNIGLPQPSKDVAVKAGLLAYWTFDNSNTDDATDNGYDGNAIGSPTFINATPNGYGKALQLQASKGQRLVIPHNMIPATFTLCFWVKDFGTGLLFGEPKGRGLAVRSDGTLYFTRWDAIFFQPLAFDYNAQEIQASGWHHIAISVSSGGSGYGGNMFRLFIDGRQVDEKKGSYWYRSSTIQFGGAITDSESSMDYNAAAKTVVQSMSFKLDNIRLYSRQLPVSDIKKIYNSEK
ncbi:MAG: hypothetical protein IJ620_00070 [Bacteroidales bacterium]|nr:hypothetical protein [Bacteroidales bacterium]